MVIKCCAAVTCKVFTNLSILLQTSFTICCLKNLFMITIQQYFLGKYDFCTIVVLLLSNSSKCYDAHYGWIEKNINFNSITLRIIFTYLTKILELHILQIAVVCKLHKAHNMHFQCMKVCYYYRNLRYMHL